MRPLPVSLAALLLVTTAAYAVKPQAWTAATQKDFASGTFQQTVVDSYGQLTLGRMLSPLDIDQNAELIPAFVQTAGGAVYVASNPDEKIYRLDGGKAKLVYNAPTGFADITAMAADRDGNLLVAFAGKSARLVQLAFQNDKPVITTRFENENVDTIWAIAVAPDGELYLGTGPHGKVYSVAADATAGRVVLDAPAKNVLALAFDHTANLIAGTDEKGLVIRLDPKTKKSYILLDAGKVDINAIVADKNGDLYVAAARTQPLDHPEEAQPENSSKPAATEPDPVEPAPSPATNSHATMNNASKNFYSLATPDDARRLGRGGPVDSLSELQGKNLSHLLAATPGQNLLADTPPELPPALKKLLARVAEKEHPASPSAHKKSPLSSHDESRPRNHAPRPSESDENDSAPNAVYRIDPKDNVTIILQEPDLAYCLLLDGDDLFIGTGNDGKLFRYRTTDESVTILARLKNEHITALFAAKNGELLVGCANAGQVYRLGASLADTGTFTSQILDAGQSATWGSALLETLPGLPPGTAATIATRTGNTRTLDAGNDKFWSDWSPEITAQGKIISLPARCLQYRITLIADPKTHAVPVVSRVHIGYETRNLPPRIKNLAIALGNDASDTDDSPQPSPSDDAAAPDNHAKISWDASDPNGDTLVYRIFYRSAAFADGKPDPWTLLAKDLKDTSWDWDTRALADGKYQVKVIASDKPDNTAAEAREVARVSSWVLVDHTPPTLGALKVSADGDKASVSGDASDKTSTVADVRYQVDSQGDWQPAAASDKIFDSAHEAFTIVTAPLAAGAHRITVRATDSAGNAAYKTATVVIQP